MAENRLGLQRVPARRDFQFFSDGLSSEVQKELKKGESVRVISRGEALYHAGDTPFGLHFIRRGLIGLASYGASGNEYLIRVSKAGQYVGHRSLFASEPHHATAVALEQSEIVSVSKSTLFSVVEIFPKIALYILEAIAKELRHAELSRVSIADKDVTSRVAESLIYLRERFPDHHWTRREIAEFCGSTTATVIRTLAKFQAEGIIRQNGRVIEVLERGTLLELAGLGD